jgi:hypothetical protein
MRFCVNGSHSLSVLKRADEIKVGYEDRKRLANFSVNIPEAVVILDFPYGFDAEWDKWKAYDEAFAEFYIALHDLNLARQFRMAGISWYWPYPITSFYELQNILRLGPSYLMIGPPLTFDLKRVKTVAGDTPLRMVANVAQPAYLPTSDNHNICGSWVRPEDVAAYDEYIQCFEFEEVDNQAEEELLKIYKEDGMWNGNLNLLIKKLNYNVDNRGIVNEFGPMRTNCHMACQSAGSCRACISAMMLALEFRKVANDRKQKAKVDK